MDSDLINFNSLYESMEKCKKGVLWKDSAAAFWLNGLENIIKLNDEIQNGTYRPRRVHKFRITSPKPRDIISIGFRDRVYQRALNDLAVYPSASKSFIYDNMACQKRKGTDLARERLKYFLHKMYRKYGNDFYVLQCDIKGYYPNMRHDVVAAKFRRFLDDSTHERCMAVLNSQYESDVGFNPGSQMVQIAGISVLDDLDHCIKEKLRIKYYLRYMDDFILLSGDKEWLESCKYTIEAELSKIGFELNEKKTKIYPISKGILFLGFTFRLTKTGKVLMAVGSKNVKRERKKLYRLVASAKLGKISKAKVYNCYNCWKNHASKGNSFELIQRMDKYFKSLWGCENGSYNQ